MTKHQGKKFTTPISASIIGIYVAARKMNCLMYIVLEINELLQTTGIIFICYNNIDCTRKLIKRCSIKYNDVNILAYKINQVLKSIGFFQIILFHKPSEWGKSDRVSVLFLFACLTKCRTTCKSQVQPTCNLLKRSFFIWVLDLYLMSLILCKVDCLLSHHKSSWDAHAT